MRIQTFFWSAVLAAGAVHAAALPAQRFTVQDLVRLERLSDVALSPDGTWLAYTVRSTDMAANKGRTSIWVMPTGAAHPSPMRISDPGANASSAAWGEDSHSLYYLSNAGGSGQVWRTRLGAPKAAAVRITDLPLDVGSFRVAPRGRRLFVSLDVFIDCADLACTQQRLAATAAAPGKGLLYDTLFARHWDAWSDGRRSQLFALSLDAAGLAAGAPIRLTAGIDGDVPSKPFGGREDYTVSPDGEQVVFAVRAGTRGEPWSTNFDLYEVAGGGGTPRNLTADNPAWDGKPAFSPDGLRLAYLAMDRPGFEADRFHLVLLDLRSGTKRPLTQAWDRSISSFAWAPDGKKLFAAADDLGRRVLWSIDATSGRPTALTGDGEVEDFIAGPRRLYFTHSTLAQPAELYTTTFAGGTAVRLTGVNRAVLAERQLSAYEQFSFVGANGDRVYGYLVKPFGWDAGAPAASYPVAFVVHGGPQGSLGDSWHYRWNAQTLAAAGYAVLMIDFHGSTGYGQAFTDSISGDWGGKPLEDLKLGLAAALERHPWMNGNEVCALGGSYGGYMMNWIAGQWPDRFKCIVSHDGIFDNRSMYYSTEELWFPEWENGGPEYSNPAAYAKHNPIDYVDRWRTPTLVVHGALDFRVPYAQGLAVFTALQRRGVPSELLFFPDENHWVLKPANSVQWYESVIGWMDRWTR